MKKPFYYEISSDNGQTWVRSRLTFYDAERATQVLGRNLLLVAQHTGSYAWGRIGKVKSNET